MRPSRTPQRPVAGDWQELSVHNGRQTELVSCVQEAQRSDTAVYHCEAAACTW